MTKKKKEYVVDFDGFLYIENADDKVSAEFKALDRLYKIGVNVKKVKKIHELIEI